ncbi:MAG: glycosyltransferase family 2 protein [Planctomycetota bacterium]|jgi:glycosyltransferase involved in cell wall biosynthesis|nr:glycosyltransferase family 2 protein [Planctomycetota bacterium]
MSETQAIYLSVVAPAHNEAENVAPLVQEVTAVASSLGRAWELIVVDDGSTDETASALRRCMADCPSLRVLSMKVRSGQTAAVEAGLREARGRFVAMMDADLQNDPADLPAMLKLLEEDRCDMVNGWRRDRKDPWIRLLSTRIANGVRNRLTHEDIRDSACGLKVFKRQCLSPLKFYNGMHRFLPTLVKMEGFSVMEVPVHHRPRSAGRAKYGVLNRVFRALRDAFAVRWMQSRTVRYECTEWER